MRIQKTNSQDALLDHYVRALQNADTAALGQHASSVMGTGGGGVNGIGNDGTMQPVINQGSQITLSTLNTGKDKE